jgi:ribosomal protein L4
MYLSLRNVPTVCGTLLSDMNTYDIVNANVLILTESAAKLFLKQQKKQKLKDLRIRRIWQKDGNLRMTNED